MVSPPSLDVVEDAVRRIAGAQDRRADTADTRAGFVLAFSALVVSLGTGDTSALLGVVSRALAAAAAVVGLWALAERDRTTVDFVQLRGFLALDPVTTRVALLTDAFARCESTYDRVLVKEARLRLAW